MELANADGLRELLGIFQLTAAHLARASGVSRQMIYMILEGKRGLSPSLRQRLIAGVHKVTRERLRLAAQTARAALKEDWGWVAPVRGHLEEAAAATASALAHAPDSITEEVDQAAPR